MITRMKIVTLSLVVLFSTAAFCQYATAPGPGPAPGRAMRQPRMKPSSSPCAQAMTSLIDWPDFSFAIIVGMVPRL